ncbi:MAG: hypothetical protein EA374_05725 [Acholeplasmatales bacterium]|nr:MAG: hypothetical protein EA374_05725 [Acholeplasmatales bacterium]
MLSVVWKEQFKRNNLIVFGIIFIMLQTLYAMFDILSFGSPGAMIGELGGGLFAVHITLNILMATLTSIMVSLSQIKLKLTKSEPRGATSIPVISFIFALLTFGCAPCVVAFLAAVGIAFTPIVLPLGNLMWKVALLGFIALSMVYILYSIDKGACKIKPEKIQT